MSNYFKHAQPWLLYVRETSIFALYNPPEHSSGGLKENGQNPDSGSKDSETKIMTLFHKKRLKIPLSWRYFDRL